jgi:hypothetical protein
MNGSGIHTSLLEYGNNYGRKKFVVAAPAQERKRLRVVAKETFPIEISSAGKSYKFFCKVFTNFGFYFMLYSLV